MPQQPAQGKSNCEGLSLVQILDMFPTDEAATKWFENWVWPDGKRSCGRYGSVNTRDVPNAMPMPCWAPIAARIFRVRSGTPMARSSILLRKRPIAVHPCVSGLKSVFSMKLYRGLVTSQPSA